MYRNLTALSAAIAAFVIVLTVASVGLVPGATPSLATASPVASAAVVGVVGTSALPATHLSQACGESKIGLGAASRFAVLAGTTVTNTGATVLNGNLGVSPGSAVTGFPPGKVTAQIDKADTAAANGQLALVTAYNAAMARTNCPITVSGNIGGKTLSPGLYHAPSSLAISSGDLTLTASGGSGKVFIFQVTSKLTVTAGRQVILAGGALASNVFWVVGSSATLGTTSIVYGSILAHKSISLATGAVLHGDALAHIGAVTLESNTVHEAGPVVLLTPSAAGTLWMPSSFVARTFA
jgi:Ice-binding-like